MVEKPNDADQEIGGTGPGSFDGERGSAPEPDRPEFRRLIQAARDGLIGGAVVGDHGALSDDPSALAELDRLGVTVLTVEGLSAEDEVPG